MKRLIAGLVVMFHLATYSTPVVWAGDGWVVTDSNGNIVSQTDGSTTDIAVAGGVSYNVTNGNIAAGDTVNINILNELGAIDPAARAIFNINDGAHSNWEGALNLIGTVAIINALGFDISQAFHANVQGGLVLSTLGINQSEFLAGITELARAMNQDPAAIINKGTFELTPQSFLALVGSAVNNEGTINANGGVAVLAAGDRVTLDISGGNGLLSAAVDAPVSAPVYDFNGNKISNAIDNSGAIYANGGYAVLTARAVDQVFDNVINHTGIIEANTVSNIGGRILLQGGDLGIVSVNGVLNALGNDLGEKGGSVHVLGEKVGLFGNARIDVSGYSGGGEVLAGGDYQGLGFVNNAKFTYMDQWAWIKANALLEGNGGKVILWADEATRAYGTIEARGGVLSGNGGLIETSGKEHLDVNGLMADAGAPAGKGGLWLLDPIANVRITNGVNTNGAFNGASPDIFSPSANNSVVNAGQINAKLNAGTSVTVTTTSPAGSQQGNITLVGASDPNGLAAISKFDGSNTATLTLLAARDIILDGTIGATAGILNLVLTAGRNIEVNNTISTPGGTAVFTATAGNITDGNGAGINLTASSLSAAAATGLNLDLDLTTLASASITGTGAINLDDVSGGLAVTSAVTTNGAITLTAAGGDLDLPTVTAGGNNRNINLTTTTGGNVNVGNITAAGDNIIINSAGSIEELGSDGGAELTSANLTLNSVAGIGALSQLEIDAATLTTAGVTGAGAIDLYDLSGGLNVTSATTSSGGIQIRTTGGNLNLGNITAAGSDITLNTDAAIEELGSDGAADLTSATLTLNAATGIGAAAQLEINAATLTNAEVSGSGSINLRDTAGGISIGTVSAAGDAVTLSATGAITDGNGADANITSGSLTVTAGGDIELDTDIDTISATANGSGNITLNESDDMVVQLIRALNDTVTLTAGGAITSGTAAFDVIAENLILSAGGNIGAAPSVNPPAGFSDLEPFLSTQVNHLEAESGGDVFLLNDGALTIGDISGLDGIFADGRIFLATQSPMIINENIISAGSGISLVSFGSGSGDDITLNALIGLIDPAENRNIELIAGDSIIFGAGFGIINESLGGRVSLLAGEDFSDFNSTNLDGTNGGDILMNDNAGILTNDGDVLLSAPDDVTSMFVTTGSGSVSMAADADASGDGNVTINGGVDSGSFFSTGIRFENNGPIFTSGVIDINHSGNVSIFETLDSSFGDGPVDIRSTAGRIILESCSCSDGILSGNGDVTLFADGNVRIRSDIRAGTGTTEVTSATSSVNGSGIIFSDTIDLNAATGIGDQGTFELSGISVSADTTSGDIDLENDSAADTTLMSLTTGNGSIDFTQTGGGNLLIGVITALNNTVTLTSEGEIRDTDAPDDLLANIAAGTINFNTGGSDIGSIANYFDIEPSAGWNVNTSGGGAYIRCLGANCAIGTIDLGTGNFFYAGSKLIDGNDLDFGEYNGATANIIAGGAEIIVTDRIGSPSNAIEFRLNNFGGVPGDGRFIAGSGTGGLYITNLATTGFGLTLGDIGGALSSMVVDGDIIIHSGSPLTVAANVTSGGNITLSALGNTATDTLTVNSGISVSSVGAGNILLTSGGTTTLDCCAVVSTTGTGNITIAAGENFTDATLDRDGFAAGSVDMNGASALRTEDGDIRVDARANARIAEVNANSDSDGTRGDVTVSVQSGFISDTNGSTVNITADQATLRAALGIGDAAVEGDDEIDTHITTLDAINTTSGHLNIAEDGAGGALNILRANQLSGGNLNIRTIDGALTVLAAGVSGLGVSATTGTTNLTADDNNNSGADNLVINHTVTSTSGNINLNASNDANFSVDGDVTSTSGNITANAGTNASAVNGGINMSDNGTTATVLNAGSGKIDLNSVGDINLTSVQTTSAATDAVLITTTNGAVVDDGGVDADIVALSGTTTLSAKTGIGSANALDTRMLNLSALTETGNIQIDNTGALNIVTANGVTGVSITDPAALNAGDFITIRTFSPLTVTAGSPVVNNSGGNITLNALGTTAGDDLTLNGDVMTLGGNGNILLTSGDTTTIANGVTVSAVGTGNVTVAAGEDFADGILDQDGNLGGILGEAVIPGGSIIMGATATVQTEDGNILMDAANNFFVGRINADSDLDNLGGDVTMFARAGSMLDADVSSILNITADDLNMTAAGVIGLPNDPIETGANTVTATAGGSVSLANTGNVVPNIFSANGNILFDNQGDSLLGQIFAPNGIVALTATGSILAITGGTHITANDLIQLIAGGIIGTAGSSINIQFNNPGTLNLSASGSDSNGLSANVQGNFSAFNVVFLNTPSGLVLLNGIPIGGAPLGQLSAAVSPLYIEPLPLNLPQHGRFDGRYTADFPGIFNGTNFAAPSLTPFDISALESVPVFETGVPTIVPLPTPAVPSVPAVEEEEKKDEQQQPTPAVPAADGDNPPAVVPIPESAFPTAPVETEKIN